MLMRKILILCFLLFFCMRPAHAQQSLLNKKISVSVKEKKLVEVLQQLSHDGDFYFSYDSKIISSDTIVSLQISNGTIREALDKLFGNSLDYKESGRYIILRKRLPAAASGTVANAVYYIKGMVKDRSTGIGIANASVYEKTKLAATLTNEDGSFVLKLKTKSARPVISFSRQHYLDTSLFISLPVNGAVTVRLQSLRLPFIDTGTITILSPSDALPVVIPDSTFILTKTSVQSINTTKMVERTRTGKFLLSAKQKVQSLNLSRFYTTRVYQLSLTPGISTHGRLSPQVENVVSINAIGGYTGGVRAFEAGGVFNINRRDVRYVQAAGVLNVVGGKVTGAQVAGVYNHVLGSVNGMQAAGIGNYVNGNMKGAQVAGIYNQVRDSISGLQVAGISNFGGSKVRGLQVSGIGNVAAQTVNGAQVAGIFNFAKKLNGVQIGLVNIADSSNGYSIGLINIVKHGYHQIAVSANEFCNANVAFKTGNRKLYSMLLAGYNFNQNQKLFTYGYGIGTSLKVSASLRLQPELSAQYVYTGKGSVTNILNSFTLNLQQKTAKNISLFVAPVCRVYVSNQTAGVDGYKYPVSPSSLSFNIAHHVNGWIGFSAGIAFL